MISNIDFILILKMKQRRLAAAATNVMASLSSLSQTRISGLFSTLSVGVSSSLAASRCFSAVTLSSKLRAHSARDHTFCAAFRDVAASLLLYAVVVSSCSRSTSATSLSFPRVSSQSSGQGGVRFSHSFNIDNKYFISSQKSFLKRRLHS